MKKIKPTLAKRVIFSILLIEFFIMLFLDKIPGIENVSHFTLAFIDTLILGSLVVLIIKYSFRPLSKIIEVTEKIRQGQLDARIKISRQDEIGTIAEQINRMAAGLQQSYKEIEEKEKLLRSITNGVEEEILLLDNNYKILWANKQATETSGLPSSEIIGNYCYKVTHRLPTPCSEPIHRCPIKLISENKKIVNILHTHRDKENNPVYFEISVYPLKLTPADKEDLYIHISRNVSERIQMLQELTLAKEKIEEYSHHLETLVEKRTQKLAEANEKLKTTEAQLIQTGKMAAIGQLATGVAHEVNNPLSTISNNTLILKKLLDKQKKADFKEIKNTLANIEEAVITCKNTTHSLLEFSHISKKGEFETVSINDLIEKIFILIEYEMKINNIIVNKNLQQDLPPVKGNPQLLQEVFFNMMINSRWAILEKSKKEGGKISVTTQYNLGDAFISIFISDTGIGIEKDQIPRIFEAFYTTKEIGSGTGLGLYLAYNIIRNHNGNIEVESTAGKGTTFKINLPIA